ncbi:hypothetical protein PQR41_15140 [Paraburkholderia xenovorans]
MWLEPPGLLDAGVRLAQDKGRTFILTACGSKVFAPFARVKLVALAIFFQRPDLIAIASRVFSPLNDLDRAVARWSSGQDLA